jgi:serine/threonine-protein kinase
MTQETGATGSASPTQTLPAGEIVAGKYQIERLIGSGGMAEVYAAVNIRTSRRVALKWILPALATSPEVLARFRREALAAGRINHPNVVTIFDVVEHQSSACMVMELLAGETLATRLVRTKPMAVEEAIAIIVLAMRGVSAAHTQGVIHRDLKPDNIFLCLDEDKAIRDVKVLDFGVSKLAAADAAMAADITMSGSVIGTPEYMAPEQVRSGKNADHRVDVYSLGVVLYEMLGGRPPFVGEHFSGLMLDIMQRDPPRLSGLRPDLPGRLVEVVHRALRKELDRRFADVASFMKAVEDVAREELEVSLGPAAEGVAAKIAAHRPTPEVRRAPRARRAGWKVGLAIATATGLAGGLSWWWLDGHRAETEPDRPPAPVTATAAAEPPLPKPVVPPVPAAADPANSAAPLPPSTEPGSSRPASAVDKGPSAAAPTRVPTAAVRRPGGGARPDNKAGEPKPAPPAGGRLHTTPSQERRARAGKLTVDDF